MARTVSVSFSDGFIGDDNGKNNVAIHTQLLSGLGWSNFQFTQQSTTGQFTLQGNDLIGTILVTDAAGVEHALAATMNWRTPSGAVTTPVFYLTASPGSSPEVLATKTGSITIDPFDKSINGDPHSFIGLTFNGKTLDVSSGTVTGNAAAASTMLKELNDYLLSQPQLSIGSVTVDEGGLFASVTVTLANAPLDASGISVGYHTVDGTATAGSDYVAQSDTLYFAQGETSKTIKVALLNDTAVENTESFNIILSDSRMAAIVNDTGIVTITDNDSASPPPVAPTVVSVVAEDALHPGLSPRDTSVVEGGKLQYTVSLSAASGGQLELPVAVGGSAAAGDYGGFEFSAGVGWKNGAAGSGILVVPANVTSFVITIPTIDNTIVEGSRTLDLTVGGKTGSGEIADDDLPPVPATVSVASLTVENAAAPSSTSVDEGGLLVYTVALSGTTSTTTEFSFLVGGSVVAGDIASPLVFSDGVAWKSGSSDTIVVPAGIGGFTVKVATVDDSLVEATETLRLTVGGKSAEGSILDNDSRGIDAVALVQSSVTEGASLVYGITLAGSAAIATEHVVALDGTASAADYGALSFSDGVSWKNDDATTLTLVVPANVGSFTVTVPTADDSLVEATETLRLTVGGKSAEGSILDNDSRGIDAVALVQSSVTEGASLVYGITLAGSAAIATEHVVALDGTASAADYGALSFSDGVSWKNDDATTLTLVVPANVGSFTVTVPTADDSLVEATETLRLTVGGKSAEGSILDNDSRGIDAVALVQSSVTEGASLVYGITLAGSAAIATEHVVALDGTASAADYGALSFSDGVSWKNDDATTLTLVVPANVGSFTVTVPTADDSLVEATETLRLTVGGKSAEGSILDNDSTPPAPPAPPAAPVPPAPTTPAKPVPPVAAPPQIGLDPKSDDGVSNTDHVTSDIAPNFNISGAGAYLREGGSVRLLDSSGAVVGASAISAAELASGKVDVRAIPLDDGQYTFMTQILDADGKVLVEAPVSVTIVTDVDGVQPSVELAANGGDFNGDGILDWQQHTVAQLPLSSLADYQAGKNAPASSFGAIMAGAPSALDPAGSVLLTGGAQLKDISITAAPTDLPSGTAAASPVFNFSLTAETPDAPLPDIDSTRAGLQTRVVIDLAPGGIVANDYLKFDAASGTWFSFLDDQRLDTMDDGATLVDLDGDGRIDRVVLTFTDGARGDDDGVANGTIVDPGLLAQVSAPAIPDTPAVPAQPAPPAAPPVYTILLANGDRYYTADATEAARVATGVDNRLEGAQFTSAAPAEGAGHIGAYYQPFTDDWHFGADGSAMPYACYAPVAGTAGFFAFAAGSGNGDIFHLYQNALGQTQLATSAQAAGLGLTAAGFSDRGAAFSASTQDAFAFDAEGFLIGNRHNASVQELVRSLAARFSSTADKGFVEAVEQAYLGMAQVVGVAHGGQASAADLNALFGTHFV